MRIKNFKNISEVSFEFVPGKINHIYGASGTGKTSIINALFGKEFSELYAAYGKTIEDIEISKDENLNYTKYRIFDKNILNKFIFNEENNLYEVIFDDANEIFQLKNEINEILNGIKEKINVIWTEISLWDNAEKSLLKLKSDGTLAGTSAIDKVSKALEGIENTDILTKDGNKITWIQQGETYIENNNCPYCGQQMPNEIIHKINEILELKATDFKSVYSSNIDVFNYIGLTPEVAVEDRNSLLSKIHENKIKIEYLKTLGSLINNISANEIDKIIEIQIKEEYLQDYNDLKSILINYNSKITEVKEKMGRIKQKTDHVVCGKVSEINKYLTKLGVNYEFNIKAREIDIDGNLCKYYLSPKGMGNIIIDHEINLSEGEKQMIAMIFFVMLKDDSILVFDDPISSSDEQRRRIIAEIIYSESSGRTVIILSHDQVFEKIVLSDVEFASKNGKILFFTNDDAGFEMSELKKEDFDCLRTFAYNRLRENLSYYQKIISLRILLEYDKHIISEKYSYERLYSYVSGIFHMIKEVDESEINVATFLNERNVNEEKIISDIKELYGIELEIFTADNLRNLDLDNYKTIEIVYYLREVLNTDSFVKQLGSFVHLNEAQVITLNPYKFNTLLPAHRNKIKQILSDL